MVALLGLLPFVCGFGPVAFVESDAARAPVTEAVMRAAATQPPAVKARAAVLVDGSNGQALWEKDADRQMPIASTTKIMTGIVAVERLKPDQVVPIRVGAADLPGLSVAGLRVGDQLPVGELVYGLMLPSGADAAIALAQATAGSTDQFVALMNRRAAELGLTNTHFVNVHGDDAPGHYSSARDLARLGRTALGMPLLAQAVAAQQHSARGRFIYSWRNTNELLSRRGDVTGIKTGTTDLAGDVLVASAEQGPRRAIVVVLNSSDRWAETSLLLDYFFKQHALVRAELPPSPFYRGLKVPAGAGETVPIWQAGLLSARIELSDSGGQVSWELAGRPFGPPAPIAP